MKWRGFLLLIQPSDKYKFKEEYKEKAKLSALLKSARRYSEVLGVNPTTLSDVTIPIEKLLQVYLAFMLDGFFAYRKKNKILEVSSEFYTDYSLKMHDNFTYDNLIRLYLIFKKADIDKGSSEDKKTPIPFYLIGFLGSLISEKNPTTIGSFFKNLFSKKKDEIQQLYNYLSDLTNSYKINYRQKHSQEYNAMIKQKIDTEILSNQTEYLNQMMNHKHIKKLIAELISNK